jgi:hypothetical protein
MVGAESCMAVAVAEGEYGTAAIRRPSVALMRKCYVCKTAGHLYRDRPKLHEMTGQARAEALAKGRQRAAKGHQFAPR